MGARHRVAIVGAGFGGLFAAEALARADVDVTVIDRTNHHLFQPLLYQMATGILAAGDIAPPIRDILRHQRNTEVVLGEVEAIDLAARRLTVTTLGLRSEIAYDSLILATGADQSYFGHPEYERHAPGMKTIDHALELRGRIFGAFELAEREPDPALRRLLMTFVVVGAGPTGVELAGQIAELAHRALGHNFRHIGHPPVGAGGRAGARRASGRPRRTPGPSPGRGRERHSGCHRRRTRAASAPSRPRTPRPPGRWASARRSAAGSSAARPVRSAA
jgi:NADH dehydrogenase FAD-containing subunit